MKFKKLKKYLKRKKIKMNTLNNNMMRQSNWKMQMESKLQNKFKIVNKL